MPLLLLFAVAIFVIVFGRNLEFLRRINALKMRLYLM